MARPLPSPHPPCSQSLLPDRPHNFDYASQWSPSISVGPPPSSTPLLPVGSAGILPNCPAKPRAPNGRAACIQASSIPSRGTNSFHAPAGTPPAAPPRGGVDVRSCLVASVRSPASEPARGASGRHESPISRPRACALMWRAERGGLGPRRGPVGGGPRRSRSAMRGRGGNSARGPPDPWYSRRYYLMGK